MAASDKKSVTPTYIDGNAVFEMGEHTLRVPMTLHQENRDRLRQRLLSNENVSSGSVIILQGGDDTTRYSSDMENIFRQESFFHWAFGVLEPGWFGAIDVATGRTILFCPRLPEEYAIWMGRITPPEEFRTRYQVDEVRYVDEGTDQGENNMENFGIAVTDTDDNVLQNNFIKEEYLEDASLACQAIFKRKREEEKQDHQIIKEFTHSAQAVVTSPPRDEHSVYGEHIGNEIRKMNYHAQCTVKHMINDIIFDAQMGMYDNPQQTGT